MELRFLKNPEIIFSEESGSCNLGGVIYIYLEREREMIPGAETIRKEKAGDDVPFLCTTGDLVLLYLYVCDASACLHNEIYYSLT